MTSSIAPGLEAEVKYKPPERKATGQACSTSPSQMKSWGHFGSDLTKNELQGMQMLGLGAWMSIGYAGTSIVTVLMKSSNDGIPS